MVIEGLESCDGLVPSLCHHKHAVSGSLVEYMVVEVRQEDVDPEPNLCHSDHAMGGSLWAYVIVVVLRDDLNDNLVETHCRIGNVGHRYLHHEYEVVNEFDSHRGDLSTGHRREWVQWLCMVLQHHEKRRTICIALCIQVYRAGESDALGHRYAEAGPIPELGQPGKSLRVNAKKASAH